MFSKLRHLYDFIEQTVKKICSRHPQEVQCKQGCADCCHAMFDISLIEACYLAQHLQENKEILNSCQEGATEAQEQFTTLRQEDADPAQARIRCPLLGEDDSCRCYQHRPINCRTYGTPTIIHGQGHVCGLSGFKKGGKYPTVNLKPIHESLYNYSEEIAPGHGQQRFTIAQVILNPERFIIEK